MGFCDLVFLSSFLLLSRISCAAEVYNITSLQPLAQGRTLVSPGRIFELGFFSPNSSGNKYVGIWHKSILPRKVVWVANRDNPLAVTDALASLTITSNGNLQLVDEKRNAVWSTNISVSSNGSPAALLLDSGNFVIELKKGDEYLWKSFDYPGDTLLPGMRLGFNSKSGKRSFWTSWKSENDPSTGKFLIGLTPQNPAQVFIWINGSTPYWRSGPWDKAMFVGIPDMDDQYLSGFHLDVNVRQGTKYFWYNLFGKTLAYLYISSEGVHKYMYSKYGENWNLHWEAPKFPCDIYGTCGPFGVCEASKSSTTPICKCLKGFVPKSVDEWSRGNRTRGCERQTELFCESNTSRSVSWSRKEDGFLKMSSVKLPDYHEYSSLDDKDCRIFCRDNCSCLAYAYVNTIGCLVWFKDLIDISEFSSGGADLFIRLANAELGVEQKKIKLIVSLASIFFIIMAAIVFSLYKLRANQKGTIKVTRNEITLTDTTDSARESLQEYIRTHDPSELLVYEYDFDSILTATSNFSITNKLGEGGFGAVYRGKLEEGKEVAVKRLSSCSGQGVEEFKNEMLLISKLQHKNLVRLMGCCIKDDEKLIIYEFMQNKSLDTLLFDPMRRGVLNWEKRFNIIKGVARGLLYLHHDSYLKVIHRDLKASNILLDENMNPKISDFGLARIFQGTQNLANTQKIVGTLGYMSPEYAMRGIFSEKSDVYSFGVLVLEIIGGWKNTSFYDHETELCFLPYIWHIWNEGKGLCIVDEVLADSYSASEAMRCLHVGLLCVQDNAADRPTMPEVDFMLSSETDRPQPKQPLFTFQNSVSDRRPRYDNTCSANEATITLLEGR
ncbi:G-type lectin S-receptor-like serine/threonine-protein kinase At1g61480 isoform X1 [Pyrus x bretschneideri]|uniref:G-type lectin S-receptor-like serine/threonine-protein kinase At1g61480 isoform X1 n=1 Tax=Pyrus x bretschneideri TaxID=225117 RepID=UPI002030E813|nr:G-type lectin S-receptor-like serine/threonine-protein kinase At1g61480 isoform X1 [Pyrus x bretschneideri]XP_048438335.1 G-type lectin S-receptor-like serine/threonine-protein kinase At1g61480 isoform X1 [Pyrus x bretschneideri]